jgi:hypothetical protein
MQNDLPLAGLRSPLAWKAYTNGLKPPSPNSISDQHASLLCQFRWDVDALTEAASHDVVART